MLSDEEVLSRVRQGDVACYEVIVARYGRHLHCIAQRMLRNEADAQDVVQETHLLALTHLTQYAGRSGLLPWLTTITVNGVRTYLRRRGSRPEGHAVPESDARPIASTWRNPEDQAILSDASRRLRNAAETLPEKYRRVFVLREIERMTTGEVGEALGISPNCVKTRLLRAWRALRERGALPSQFAPVCQKRY